MAVLSVLTPIFVAVLCVVCGLIFKNSRETETTSKAETKIDSKVESRPAKEARPWVDEDLQDDTDMKLKDDGRLEIG